MSFFKESFSTGSPFLLKILTIFQGGGKSGEKRARARSGFRNNGYGKVMTGRSQLSKGPRGPYAAPLLNGELMYFIHTFKGSNSFFENVPPDFLK